MRSDSAIALSPVQLACVLPDQFDKWSHFRHTLLRERMVELLEEDSRLDDLYTTKRASVLQKIDILEVGYVYK